MRKQYIIAAMILALAQPVASEAQQDDIAFVRQQIKRLEDAGIDASEMRGVLRQMEIEAARNAARTNSSVDTPPPQFSAAQGLIGSWSHPTKGTWSFAAGGKATLVRDSVNGIPGRYTITMTWSQEGSDTLVYSPIRNTLVGSPDSDRDEPIPNPKTYRAPFQIVNGKLLLGGAEYIRQ